MLAGCGAPAAPAASPAASPSPTVARQVLKVGMECAYAPFNWSQPDASNGAVQISNDPTSYANGYDVQMAKKVADYLGMDLAVVKTEWDGLIPGLTSGKLDAIIAGMSPTDERKQVIDFSDYYYESDLVVVVKANGPYANAKSINDFYGAKITAQLNTTHYTVIDQMKGVVKQTAMEDFPAMIVALQSGKIDGYISERPGALAAVHANPDLSFVSFENGGGFNYDVNEANVSIGIKKDSDLTAKVNAALAQISKDQRAQLMNDAVDQSTSN